MLLLQRGADSLSSWGFTVSRDEGTLRRCSTHLVSRPGEPGHVLQFCEILEVNTEYMLRVFKEIHLELKKKIS